MMSGIVGITVRVEPGLDTAAYGVEVLIERRQGDDVQTVSAVTSARSLPLALAQARQVLWNLEHHDKPFMRAGEVREASGG